MDVLGEKAAAPVDCLDVEIVGIALALAVPGRAARHRPEDPDLDRLLGERRAAEQDHHRHRDREPGPLTHVRSSFSFELPGGQRPRVAMRSISMTGPSNMMPVDGMTVMTGGSGTI